MKEVFDFAKGKLSYENFAAAVDAKPERWAFLQGLVPKDIADENCDYRKKYGVTVDFYIVLESIQNTKSVAIAKNMARTPIVKINDFFLLEVFQIDIFRVIKYAFFTDFATYVYFQNVIEII